MAKEEPRKLVCNNKKAYHDYFIEEKYEAGLELFGTEVKSLRLGKCSVKESFIRIEKGEVYAYGMHITPYEMGNIFNKDPLRPKKLLLHKREIDKLDEKVRQKGLTLVPSKIYFNDKGKVKLEICLCRGKNTIDKKQDLKEKDLKRDLQRELKSKNH